MANGTEKDVEALLLRERNFRRRPGEVVYPLEYSNVMITYDNWDHIFFKNCFGGLTMTQFDVPPAMVLDLGCGGGLWAVEAAGQWKNSTIIGFDCIDIQPKIHKLDAFKDLAQRLKWVRGNLLDGLPFPSNHFDLIRMARIGLGVPEDEWQFVLEEVSRVMKPGAVLEIIEEDLIFPYCQSARTRPRPPPLTVDLPQTPSDSLPSSRSSMTAVSANPWARSQESMLMDGLGSIRKKASLSPLHESPTSSFPTPPTHFSPKSASSHTSFTSSHIHTPRPPPPPNSFQTHPQDHSRLKAAWDAMLARRFLTPQLITVLPFYLSSWFEDVKTHPTFHAPLPASSASSSSEARIFCTFDDSTSTAFDPKEQFAMKRSTGRRSDSEEKTHVRDSDSSLGRKRLPSWAPMHLARNVQTVKGCKEAIWEEYAKLHSPDLPPTTTQSRPKDGRIIISTKSAAREGFDRAWANWENDMADRIGMRDSIMLEFSWPEPPGERPDWRVWRNNLDLQHVEETKPPNDICRTLRGFVAWKPK